MSGLAVVQNEARLVRAIAFTVPGALATKGSGRAYTYRRKDGRIGARVTNDNARAAGVQTAIGWAAREALGAGAAMLEGAIAIRIECELARPRSARRRPWPIVKPDADKIARLVLDSLTRIAYRDDAAICQLEIRKVYSTGPARVRIRLEELGGVQI